MESLESFELLCLQYLKAAKTPVPDEVKLGVITGSLVQSSEGSQTNKIGERLLFNAEKFTTYADPRQEIHRIILSKKFPRLQLRLVQLQRVKMVAKVVQRMVHGKRGKDGNSR